MDGLIDGDIWRDRASLDWGLLAYYKKETRTESLFDWVFGIIDSTYTSHVFPSLVMRLFIYIPLH